MFNKKNRKSYSLKIFNVNIWAFDHVENKHSLYRGEDCMKKFRELFRKHATVNNKKRIL